MQTCSAMSRVYWVLGSPRNARYGFPRPIRLCEALDAQSRPVSDGLDADWRMKDGFQCLAKSLKSWKSVCRVACACQSLSRAIIGAGNQARGLATIDLVSPNGEPEMLGGVAGRS